MTVYFGLTAVILNLVIAVVLTPVFKAMRLSEGADETQPSHYTYDPASPLPSAPAVAPTGTGAASASASAGD
jgi:solute:Na+ symporter, SSS family